MTADTRKLSGLWCDAKTLGFGIVLYACFAREFAGPVGFVWGIGMAAGNAGKSRFEVFGSYVLPWARRAGVRSALNKSIRESYDVITTQNGSGEGGEAFMCAAGYRMDRASGVWPLAKGKRP